MYSLLFLAVTSLILSLILTPVIGDLFLHFGLVDLPDARRKLHSQPIPRVGGIAVALSFLISVVLLTTTGLKGGWLILQSSPLIWKLAPAVFIVFLIGLWDDLAHLKAWHKLIGEVGAAAAAYFAGVHVVTVGGTSFSHWWSLPLTLLWLVGCCNAVNLIDGVDGLAAGLSLVSCVSMLVAAALQHNVLLAYATVPLVGCLLGFLRYNFSPASVFLGDCGSLTIGFLLGCYGVLWSQKSATVLGMAAPLMALAIPLLDTLLAISRRFLRRQPIFGADRGHIHHRLLDLGHSPRMVAMLLCGICAVASAFSLCMSNNQLEIPVIVIFGVGTWFGVQKLGYIEFDTTRRMLIQGSFRQLISSQIALRNVESKLTAASSPDDCWNVLQEVYQEMGLCYIEMRLMGRAYSTKPSLLNGRERWHLEVPLSDSDYVLMAHEFNAMASHTIVALMPDILRRILEAKRTTFRPMGSEKLLSTAAAGN